MKKQEKAKVKGKPKVMFLSRDDNEFSQNYNLTLRSPKWNGNSYWFEAEGGEEFCPKQFERMTGLRLSPGEGPVKVRLVPEEGA